MEQKIASVVTQDSWIAIGFIYVFTAVYKYIIPESAHLEKQLPKQYSPSSDRRILA